MDRRPRLLLVNPALHNRMQDRSGGLLQPLGLAYLAAIRRRTGTCGSTTSSCRGPHRRTRTWWGSPPPPGA